MRRRSRQVASWQQRFNNLSQRLYDELHDDSTTDATDETAK